MLRNAQNTPLKRNAQHTPLKRILKGKDIPTVWPGTNAIHPHVSMSITWFEVLSPGLGGQKVDDASAHRRGRVARLVLMEDPKQLSSWTELPNSGGGCDIDVPLCGGDLAETTNNRCLSCLGNVGKLHPKVYQN